MIQKTIAILFASSSHHGALPMISNPNSIRLGLKPCKCICPTFLPVPNKSSQILTLSIIIRNLVMLIDWSSTMTTQTIPLTIKATTIKRHILFTKARSIAIIMRNLTSLKILFISLIIRSASYLKLEAALKSSQGPWPILEKPTIQFDSLWARKRTIQFFNILLEIYFIVFHH